jgi:hypothetical protein
MCTHKFTKEHSLAHNEQANTFFISQRIVVFLCADLCVAAPTGGRIMLATLFCAMPCHMHAMQQIYHICSHDTACLGKYDVGLTEVETHNTRKIRNATVHKRDCAQSAFSLNQRAWKDKMWVNKKKKRRK